MLLDAQGHLKLADFGTCMRMDKVDLQSQAFVIFGFVVCPFTIIPTFVKSTLSLLTVLLLCATNMCKSGILSLLTYYSPWYAMIDAFVLVFSESYWSLGDATL